MTANDHLKSRIHEASISAPLTTDAGPSKAELDSHANMLVFNDESYIFDAIQDKSTSVEPFDPSIGVAKNIPIVDAALAYDCPTSGDTYILVTRNILHVSTMSHHLLCPFIMREAGVVVNDVAKIHKGSPTRDDHSILFPEAKLHIPLKLNGIFSYFNVRKPKLHEVRYYDKVFITPDSTDWDPYSAHFSENEDLLMDSDGNILDFPHAPKHVIDIPSPLLSTDNFEVACNRVLDTAFCSIQPASEHLYYCPSNANFVTSISDQLEISKHKMSIGSTSISRTKSCNLFLSGEIDDVMEGLQEVEIYSTVVDKPTTVSADFLSNIWSIDETLASKAIEKNTHLNRRNHDNDLTKHFHTNDRMLRYKRIQSLFFTDTFFVTKKAKSSRGHTCAQIFVSDKEYVAIYFMKSKSEFYDALHMFCKEVGVPQSLVVDPSGEQTSNKVKKLCHQVGTTLRILEESTQWANRAELYIGLFKEAIRKDMREANSPLVFWDYCAYRRSIIHNLTPRNLFQLQGETPILATLGEQGDISTVAQYKWYDWCYFRETGKNQFPHQYNQLGRVLGPCKNEGNEMAQHILKINGQVVPRRTTKPLTKKEWESKSEDNKRASFDAATKSKFGDSISLPPIDESIDLGIGDFIMEPNEPGEETIQDVTIVEDEDPLDSIETLMFEEPINDILINAECRLPLKDQFHPAIVRKRSVGKNGREIGMFDPNPVLNTVLYDVDFNDGSVRQYTANVIAQNLFDQVDIDGYSLSRLEAIVDYRKEKSALTKKAGQFQDQIRKIETSEINKGLENACAIQ